MDSNFTFALMFLGCLVFLGGILVADVPLILIGVVIAGAAITVEDMKWR